VLEVTLFAGPSLYRVNPARVAAAGVRLVPPAQRGDIIRLVLAAPAPGVILLCDGVFQSCPAVSHAELCRALDCGWQVWGVSSLGAIRAAELRHEGMRGFGLVYAMYAGAPALTDDEACLLHYPEAPWFPVSEALVNVREALRRRSRVFGISESAASAIAKILASQWFGERTPQRIQAVLSELAGLDEARATAFLAWLDRHPLKSLDLARLLRCRPWLQPIAPVAIEPAPSPGHRSASSPGA
jgi:hypothetical protein